MNKKPPQKPIDTEGPTLNTTSIPASPSRQGYTYKKPVAARSSQNNWGLVIIAIALLGFTIIGSIAMIFILSTMNGNDDNSGDNSVSVSNNHADPTSEIYGNPTLRAVMEAENSTFYNQAGTPIAPDTLIVENEDGTLIFDPAVPIYNTQGTPLPSGQVVTYNDSGTPLPPRVTVDMEIPVPTSALTPVAGAIENSLQIDPWDGEERFTVLVMGLDNRPAEGRGTCRTDSMMIISIDPISQQIGILSIPRDTYVEVPGYGLNRVNAACTIGNVNNPGSGPRLAMQTVQYNFGIRINDYFLVDFNAFIRMIDEIGGITVNVERTINDPAYPDMNYGYDPFYLEAGERKLDGATALKYARSRHDAPGGDVDRAERQQQILYAVRDKVLNLDMLDDLIRQSPVLWSELENGIDTGLNLEQIVRLALYARDIPGGNIKSGVVSYEYLIGYRTEGGASVLIPNRNRMITLLLEVFGEGYNR